MELEREENLIWSWWHVFSVFISLQHLTQCTEPPCRMLGSNKCMDFATPQILAILFQVVFLKISWNLTLLGSAGLIDRIQKVSTWKISLWSILPYWPFKLSFLEKKDGIPHTSCEKNCFLSLKCADLVFSDKKWMPWLYPARVSSFYLMPRNCYTKSVPSFCLATNFCLKISLGMVKRYKEEPQTSWPKARVVKISWTDSNSLSLRFRFIIENRLTKRRCLVRSLIKSMFIF